MKFFLDPDETFLDSRNLPSFNEQQFEGQIEKPISRRTFYFLGGFFLLVGLIFIAQVSNLQLINGQTLAARGASNTLRRSPIFAERGIITDRFGQSLAWNDNGRRYLNLPGFAHLLGYLSYPTGEELKAGYDRAEWVGRDGAEKIFNDQLRGQPGVRIEEVDVAGEIQSDYLLQPPVASGNLTLSIDAQVEGAMYRAIDSLVSEGRFTGGAGVMMDVATGEIIALTSAPEYDSNVLASGQNQTKIKDYLRDERHPFFNRAVAGAYTPGSIVKPVMAAAALSEHLINPDKKILSTGRLVVPNPYFPDQPSIFKDWKALGWVDLRDAIAVSSDVYFYTIGGGFGEQAGLGIERIDKYARLFGLGQKTGSPFPNESTGVIPTPAWKAANFNGANWLLGDTYHTVIGQYGFQVTLLQVVRMSAAIANGGRLVRPTIVALKAGETPDSEEIPGLAPGALLVVREGMRRAVTGGTIGGLNAPALSVAAKTGTAELGTSKKFINAWVTGFFPYDNPRYAFALVLERGARDTTIGATYAMRRVFDWMLANTPEYFKS